MEKVPNEYFCTYKDSPLAEVSCVPDDFCEDPSVVSYRPNMDLEESYINWISHYDLTCATKGQIGLIASSIGVGWMLTLTFIPRLSDLYGREKLIKFGNVVITIALFLQISTHSYTCLILS